MKACPFSSVRHDIQGLCLIATLAAACTFDASKLRGHGSHDGAVEHPSIAADAGDATSQGDGTGSPDLASSGQPDSFSDLRRGGFLDAETDSEPDVTNPPLGPSDVASDLPSPTIDVPTPQPPDLALPTLDAPVGALDLPLDLPTPPIDAASPQAPDLALPTIDAQPDWEPDLALPTLDAPVGALDAAPDLAAPTIDAPVDPEPDLTLPTIDAPVGALDVPPDLAAPTIDAPIELPPDAGVSAQLLIAKGALGSSTMGIYTLNSDGTGQSLVHLDAKTSGTPTWSSDKSQVVYSSNNSTTGKTEVFLMNSDGTNNLQITFDSPAYGNNAPLFRSATKIWYSNAQSAGYTEINEINYDGTGKTVLTSFYSQVKAGDWVSINNAATRLVYYKQASSWSPNGEIYTANMDFSGEVRLTNNTMFDGYPKFSPDGAKIVFTRDTAALSGISNVFVMNADGTGVTQLTSYASASQSCYRPLWSPSGEQLAYTLCDGSQCDIWTMRTDGTSPVNITNTPGYNEYTSDWR